MTLVDEYSNNTREAQGAWVDATQAWAQSTQKAVEQFPAPFLGSWPGDAVAVVDRWFDFAAQVLDANRQYAKNLAGVANTFGGAVRQHVDSLGEAVRDQVQAVSDTAVEQVEKAQAAEQEKVEGAEQAEREQARQERAAERAQARQKRAAARERYEGMTKAELSEQLARRELPKSGNVDELIERLVDADTE
jgi:hypothetical protein